MLELKNICKSYGEKIILEKFSMTFPKIGTFALLGRSGCGKTTLLRLISSLEKADSGEINLPNSAKISVVFQEDRLLDVLNVRENIMAVLSRKEDARQIADECLARCGLLDAANMLPQELSGGMKRRVAIARAMAFDGDILLLDEPFKGLDDETKRDVAKFVFEKSKSRLTLFITHDSDEAQTYADKIIRFDGLPLKVVEGGI